MIRQRDEPKLLEWIKRTFHLESKAEAGVSHTFGPFPIKNRELCVSYDGAGGWSLHTPVDTRMEDYHRRRGEVVAVADRRRGELPRLEFVKLLIRTAIAVGITDLAGILQAVDLAANREIIQESLDSGLDLDTAPTPFTEKYVRGVLSRFRGLRTPGHLWWVDGAKIYHLH